MGSASNQWCRAAMLTDRELSERTARSGRVGGAAAARRAAMCISSERGGPSLASSAGRRERGRASEAETAGRGLNSRDSVSPFPLGSRFSAPR